MHPAAAVALITILATAQMAAASRDLGQIMLEAYSSRASSMPSCTTAAVAEIAEVSPTSTPAVAAIAPTCTVNWPPSAAKHHVRDVTLSNDCPVHSNACSGPSHALPFQDVFTPCCHAHDWCYSCGWKVGLWGIRGREQCDITFMANMQRVCEQKFEGNRESLKMCLATAGTMFAAVASTQGALGIGNTNTDACPGESSKLAHVDFCFNPVYELSRKTRTISPGNGGRWGAWTNFAECPTGSWASGLSARVEPDRGWMDDTGLNAVQLACSDRRGGSTETNLKPHDGWRGYWSSYSHCPAGYHISALRLQVQAPQGFWRDDTAANTLQARCSDGRTVLTHDNSNDIGDWSEWVSCPNGSAVCAIQIKIEQQGAADDTALNDIKASCCTL